MSKSGRISYRRSRGLHGRTIDRASRSIDDRRELTNDAADHENILHNRQRLIEISHQHGLRVIHGEKFLVRRRNDQRYIQTDERCTAIEWTASMLHELGHAELLLRGEKHHRYATRRLSKAQYHFRSITGPLHRFFLRMEWKAWDQGLIIAKREGIRITAEQYMSVAVPCYRTYLHYVRRGSYFRGWDLRNDRIVRKSHRMKTARRRSIQRELEEGEVGGLDAS